MDPGARRQDPGDPRPTRTTPGSRRRSKAATTASAPSSAASFHASMLATVDAGYAAARTSTTSRPGRTRSASRSGTASARPATGTSGRAATARTIASNSAAQVGGRAASDRPQRRHGLDGRRCRPSATPGPRRSIRRLVRLREEAHLQRLGRRERRVAARSRSGLSRRLEERPCRELARHGRPQADRDHVHRDLDRSGSSRAGSSRSSCASQLATPSEKLLTKNSYNEVMTMHGTTMIFLVVVPILAGFAQLPRAADDRRAGHGVPAPERALVLALPARRHRALAELVREGRRGARRLVVVPDAVGEPPLREPRPRPGLLDPLDPHPHAVVARWGRSTSSSRSTTCAPRG